MIKLFFLKLENENFDSDLLPLVSNESKKRISKYKFDSDKKLSLFGELIVRAYIVRNFNIENEKIAFAKDKNNKPYLLNNPGFHFNISHTKAAVAAAVSDSEIGVDIELMRDFDFDGIIKSFSCEERKIINSSEDRRLSFFETWTKKEAYIKYTGEGLSRELSSFNVYGDEFLGAIRTFQQKEYIISVCSKDSEIHFAKLTPVCKSDIICAIK